MNFDSVLRYLREMSFRFELADDTHRRHAYQRAADSIAASGSLDSWSTLPGVGKSIRTEIDIVLSGQTPERLTSLRASGPPASVFDLVRIPGIGVKKAAALASSGIVKIEDLAAAVRQCQVADPALVRAFYAFRAVDGVHTRTSVAPQACALVEHAKSLLGVLDAELVGSYRRRRPDIRDLELLVVCDLRKMPMLVKAISAHCRADATTAGDRAFDLYTAGQVCLPLRVHFCSEDERGITAVRLSSGAGFWSACEAQAAALGIKINRWTLTSGGQEYVCPTESIFFDAIGVEYVHEACRENAEGLTHGSAALSGDCLIADMHRHTTASSGINTMIQVRDTAKRLGHLAVGVCDNVRSFGHGVAPAGVAGHRERAKAAGSDKVPVIAGVELDIHVDGGFGFDIADIAPARYVMLSISADPHKNTLQRYTDAVRALRSKYPKMPIAITRPSTREIGKRLEAQLDWSAFYRLCCSENVAVDINGDPCRADPEDRAVAVGKNFRCKFLASSNAKACRAVRENLDVAVDMANRALLTKSDVLNSTTSTLQHWLAGGDLRRLG